MRLTGAGARCLGVLSVAVACRSSKVPQPAVEQWAHWPMPNAHVAGLPNPHDYDMSTAGVVADRITGLRWQRHLSNTFLSCGRRGNSAPRYRSLATTIGGYRRGSSW